MRNPSTGQPGIPVRSLPFPARGGLLLGLGVFALALALYGSTMATSFAPGDSANYLNLANTGGLNDRGNGLPLYITVLNAAVHFPLPFALSDGFRCNLLTVLMAAGTVFLCYVVSLRATSSPAAALVASVAVLVSGLVWESSTRIMPHITLPLIAVVFLEILLREEESRSRRAIFALGLTCGLGFGLMPNALLFLPGAALALWLGTAARSRVRSLAWLAAGALGGILVNVVLIVVHESLAPTMARDGTSVSEAVWFYLRGGNETSWFLHNVTLGHFLRGLVRLPLDIAADFEIVGTVLAFLGGWIGLRERRSLHLSLLLTFVIIGLWVGTYPGDTRSLHGLAAYPIAALWLAIGARRVLTFLFDRLSRSGPARVHQGLLRAVLGASLAVALLVGVAGGKLLYTDRLCAMDPWLLHGFCRERVPEPTGDRYLVQARDAIARIPQGALVFGAAWDAAHQMNYFIRVHRTRADLEGAFDLTKVAPARFDALARPYFDEGRPVYLYGEWKDVEMWSAPLLGHFQAEPRGEFVFELVRPSP